MKMTFRWYGEEDPVTLEQIRQIPGMKGVVSAIYDVPVGQVWPLERLRQVKQYCESKGLQWEVVESVPVHESIKLGKPERMQLTKNYAQTIRNLGEIGIRCICYNFMPVFDWLRTNLHSRLSDGSEALSYCPEELKTMDPRTAHLPGWDESYTQTELNGLLREYEGMTDAVLFNHLVWFLEQILPACRDTGIVMAIHPDDPPWRIFGLPRIISSEQNLDALFSAVPDCHNGLTFCTGSLGLRTENNLVSMAEKYAAAGRIFFAHLRNIQREGPYRFAESAHLSSCGSLDMYGIVRALTRAGFDGYVRPDHGRMIWGEKGKPGYGLYDRALGAAYLNGLFEGARKEKGI